MLAAVVVNESVNGCETTLCARQWLASFLEKEEKFIVSADVGYRESRDFRRLRHVPGVSSRHPGWQFLQRFAGFIRGTHAPSLNRRSVLANSF